MKWNIFIIKDLFYLSLLFLVSRFIYWYDNMFGIYENIVVGVVLICKIVDCVSYCRFIRY